MGCGVDFLGKLDGSRWLSVSEFCTFVGPAVFGGVFSSMDSVCVCVCVSVCLCVCVSV